MSGVTFHFVFRFRIIDSNSFSASAAAVTSSSHDPKKLKKKFSEIDLVIVTLLQ